ncbi:MAG: hypothetical protein Q8P18_19440 [Pseudomonadota bacterium]|nr:hypothetical protein [Pseudomonadota bacterium]
MLWLLALLACLAPSGPATTGSRSADLALRASEVSRRADVLAERTRTLEGLFDELRAAPPAQREETRARIQAQAEGLRVEAEALRDEVVAIEAAAEVW